MVWAKWLSAEEGEKVSYGVYYDGELVRNSTSTSFTLPATSLRNDNLKIQISVTNEYGEGLLCQTEPIERKKMPK